MSLGAEHVLQRAIWTRDPVPLLDFLTHLGTTLPQTLCGREAVRGCAHWEM